MTWYINFSVFYFYFFRSVIFFFFRRAFLKVWYLVGEGALFFFFFVDYICIFRIFEGGGDLNLVSEKKICIHVIQMRCCIYRGLLIQSSHLDYEIVSQEMTINCFFSRPLHSLHTSSNDCIASILGTPL